MSVEKISRSLEEKQYPYRYMVWGVSNNILAVLDLAGNFYYYSPVFSGNDVVVMTFTGSIGYSEFTLGTQFYYTRVRF